ncbi:acyl-CoA dehydrogenase [Xylogone sp. PMI_703]|nr:acyl-CoA dehydrogenase [Xylogone sp. PMI_703]
MTFFGSVAPFVEPLWYSRDSGWRYTSSHRRVREETRAYIDKEIRPFCEEWEAKGEVPDKVLRHHAELGYIAALFNPTTLGKHLSSQRLPGDLKPEDWDGLHQLICNDEVARCSSLGVIWALGCGTSIGLPPVINFGTSEQCARFIPDVITGNSRFCLALTEPDAGSDIANMTTTASLKEDVFIVNGTKKWITNVRTGSPGREGLSLLVIPLNAEGVLRTPIATSGVASSGCAMLTFNSVKVPVSNLLGEINKGFKPLMMSLNTERLLISANCIRLARVCVEDAHDYAITRETFSQPLINRPTIRLKFTNMGAQIMGAYALLESLMELTYPSHKTQSDSHVTGSRSDIGGLCALTKITSARALELAVRECQQIMGARGYSKSGPGARIERISRDMRTLAVGGGSEEILGELAVTQERKDLLKAANNLP